MTDAPSSRTRVRRAHETAAYDRATIDAVLDAGLVATLAYVVDDQPFATPVYYWRRGDHVYWHGSAASRMMRHVATGAPVCLTVHHLDALVLARSGFHHSMAYRSVMVLGRAEEVTGPAGLDALRDSIERLSPGRWEGLRPPSDQELKATLVVRLALDEASAKIATGGPNDPPADRDWPVWAGTVPVQMMIGKPRPAADGPPDAAPPALNVLAD